MDNVGHPAATSRLGSQTEGVSPLHATPLLPSTRCVEIPPSSQQEQPQQQHEGEVRRPSASESTAADVEDAYDPSPGSSGADGEGGGSQPPAHTSGGPTTAVYRSASASKLGSGGGLTTPRSAVEAPTYPPPATPPSSPTVSSIPRPSGLLSGKVTMRPRTQPVSPLMTPPTTPASTAMAHTAATARTGGSGETSSSTLSPASSEPVSPRSHARAHAHRTPASDAGETEISTSSEAKRELAQAEREGRVIYESARGEPIVPLGDVLDATGHGDGQQRQQGEGPVAVRQPKPVGALSRERAVDDVESAAIQGGGPREGLKADLDRYQTLPAAPLAPTTLLPSHLPNLAYVAPTAPTSLPIPATAVQHDLDQSLGKLLSEDVFWEMLRNPLGRHRFRAYLMGLGKEEVLDLWWDAELCEQIAKMVRDGASAIQAVYFDSTNGALERLCPGSESQLVHAQSMDSSFSSLSKAVLKGMYQSHFKAFIQRKLVEQSQVKLGLTGPEREGIGEVFCVTNGRLRDNPIVLVSSAFCKMTGYRAEAILGRNCRFLQGPGTSPGSVQRIRQAIIAGEEHTELLLNYRSSGEPFWNLLAMIPLRARDGSVAYFVGGQIDVTGSIQSSRRLSFLIGGASSTYSAEGIPKLNTFEFSPTLVAHRPMLAKDLRDFQGINAEDMSREIAASQMRNQQAQHGRPLGGLSSHARQELEGPSYESTTEGGLSGAPRPPKTILDRLKHFVGAGPAEKVDDQLLSPAEKSWQSVGPLQPQMDLFSSTYRKLLVIRPKGQEILYVTRSLIAFLGLPIISSQDLFSCSILHTDLLSLLELSTRDATRRARDKIRSAMRTSEAVSLVVGLRVLPQSTYSLGIGKKTRDSREGEGLKRVALHLTPLTDRDGVTGAYICIVS